MVAGTMKREDETPSSLVTSREPKVTGPGKSGSVGDVALRDAVIALAVAWALLFLLAFSLRSHNV